MGYFSEHPCSECASNCAPDRGLFVLIHVSKGEIIDLSHQRSRLFFIQKGRLRIRSESMDEYICSTQQIVLLTERNHYNIEALEDCELLSLSFIRAFQTCDIVRIDQAREEFGSYEYRFHALPMNIEMQLFVESIVRYLNNSVNCVYMHNAKQTELFIIYRYYYSAEMIFKFFRPIIDRDMNFEFLVKSNYKQARTVEQLANLCGYNVHTFKKLFDRYFGESPYQWMMQQNAQRIKTKLLDLSVPIKVIVSEFGFTNQSHLNLFCKRRWGATAKQLRVQLTQSGQTNR